MLLLDKIIIGVLCFFFLTGWIRGFLKAFIGPLSFLICFLSAAIFYDINRNILMAVFIATGGTLILTVTLNILLALGMATVNKEYRGKVFPLSRILGSVVNVVWQGNIVFLTILLLSTLPIDDKRMDALRTQVPESKMMNFYKETIINRDVRFQAVVKSLGTLRDPDEVAQIAHTPEFEAFRKQPKLQKFINDPDVIQAMESKNGLKLIGNPSLRELLTDDSAMMSFTSLAQMVYQKNFKDLAETSEKKPAS